MPNTFNADGRPDLMSPQDQYAYLKATGVTIDDRPVTQQPAQEAPALGAVDPSIAREYQTRIAAEDADRRSTPKRRQTSFGLPISGKP